MDKQKVRPLDEERESRSLLSNAVVILHLVFGTLPLLLVVWAVDRLMSDTFASAKIWIVGAVMVLFRLASRRVLRNVDLAGAPLSLQRPHTVEVTHR